MLKMKIIQKITPESKSLALCCSIDYLVGKSNELEKFYSLSQVDKNKVIDLIEELSKK